MKRIIRAGKNEEGSTLIEFAVIAPVFFLVFLGIVEYGMYMLTQIAIEGAVSQGGRMASVGSGADLATRVREDVMRRTSGLPNAGNIVVTANLIGAGATSAPDVCVVGGNPSTGSCPSGSPFIDNNGNGVFDAPGGVSLGAPGDMVEIRASYPWRVMIPLFSQFVSSTDQNGNRVNGVAMITSSTVIRNEPSL